MDLARENDFLGMSIRVPLWLHIECLLLTFMQLECLPCGTIKKLWDAYWKEAKKYFCKNAYVNFGKSFEIRSEDNLKFVYPLRKFSPFNMSRENDFFGCWAKVSSLTVRYLGSRSS